MLHSSGFFLVLVSVMMDVGLSLLMIAGLLDVSDLQSDQTIRQFRYVGLAKNWSDAQTYCRERFSDLAAILNAANGTEARQAAGTSRVWIGLSNGTWKWSWDENQLSPGSSMFTMWSFNEPQDRKCTLFSKTGFWSAKACGDLNDFLCYDGSSNSDVLVKQKMSWFDAQTYCRETHTDLTTIRDITKNYRVTSLLPDSTFSFQTFSMTPAAVAWIGLHRSDWVWSDGSSASYWPWATQATTEQADCVMMDSSSGSWFQQSCSDSFSFLCSEDVVPTATRALKIRLEAGSADLNDAAVQESILQQLRQKMEEQEVTEEVKLSWRIQPDGKVFHRQQEEAAPPACEAETCDSV
ncbi:macrophage mannose receptor 1-like [Poecilia reticulata]|uniref:macrophage mannose receptor 1-like n=1 Tax=Poecilia reticulata TaxID=8081 RepID=UPI0007EAC212|nr:PREDICTED: macrophage mannose receptor 1-like [Poecilia reticulata]